MVIIDTSAWVDFFRRDGDLPTKLAVKGLLDAYEGALCGPVELEFLYQVEFQKSRMPE